MSFNIPFKSGDGVFTPSSLVDGVLALGLTGTLLSVAEVEGVVYKITQLSAASASAQPGISLIVNGVTLHDQQILDDIQPTANPGTTSFLVSQGFGNSNTSSSRYYSHIFCTSFSVLKNAGNTAESIYYVYQIGSVN